MAIMGTSLAVTAIVGNGTPEQIAEWAPQCFGTLEHVLAPEAITEESLVELSRFMLGESRRIGPLLLKDA